MSFGENVKKYRTELNLTQEQLGEKIGISAQAVSKWENNETLPDTALLPTLSDALRVSLDELFDCKTLNRESVCRQIDAYLRSDHTVSAEGRILDLMASAFRAYFGLDPIPTYDSFDAIDHYTEIAHSSFLFIRDHASGLLYETPAFPFGVIAVEPDGGWGKIIDDSHVQTILSALGDPDGFKCMRYLMTKTSCAIEASLLFRYSGADANRMDEVLEKLDQADLVIVKHVNIAGKERTIVQSRLLDSEYALMPLFMSAYALYCTKKACRNSSGIRTKPYITE